VGDRVVSFDGVPVTSWSQFTQLVRDHGPGTASVVVDRQGRRLTFTPDLVQVLRDRKTGGEGTDPVGAIGIRQGEDTKHYGPIAAIPRTGSFLWSGVTGMYDPLTHRLSSLGDLFSNKRDANGFVSVVGAARIGGDVVAAPDAS